MKTQRTPKQILASYLRRNEYKGCYGQTSDHGCGNISIQIFADNTPDNHKRFPNARINNTGTLCVADFNIS